MCSFARQPQIMTARLQVRSQRQAMDWSLALVSQGIETTIEFSAEAGWGLLLHEEEYDRAVAVVRLYRSENLRRPWHRRIGSPGFFFDWGALAWVLVLAVFFQLSESSPDLRSAGVMDSVKASHGQWWRMFTAIYLHADLGHLAANASLGLIFLGLAMGRYGTGVGLLASLLTGAGGNALAWFTDQAHRSLGASGVVMGALGLLTAPPLFGWRRDPRWRQHLLGGFAVGGMLFVLLGLSPGSDVVAHFGGFVTGLFLGGMLLLEPRWAGRGVVSFLAGSVFCLLTLLTWWLALRAGL